MLFFEKMVKLEIVCHRTSLLSLSLQARALSHPQESYSCMTPGHCGGNQASQQLWHYYSWHWCFIGRKENMLKYKFTKFWKYIIQLLSLLFYCSILHVFVSFLLVFSFAFNCMHFFSYYQYTQIYWPTFVFWFKGLMFRFGQFRFYPVNRTEEFR